MFAERDITAALPAALNVWDEYIVPPVKFVDDSCDMYAVSSGFDGLSVLSQVTAADDMYIAPQDTTSGGLHKVALDIFDDTASTPLRLSAITRA